MRQTSNVIDNLLNPDSQPPQGSFRPRIAGKSFQTGNSKLYLRGVTYGTFRPNDPSDACLGSDYGAPGQVEVDFASMAQNGINAVRLYTVPPLWLLDIASRYGLQVMVGIPWEQHIAFLDSRKQSNSIKKRISEGVRGCAGHPAVLGYAIGNEIPSSIVRWYGHRRIERALNELYVTAKEQDPAGLVTYVNYPTTEYLELPFLDFVSFNVYLEDRERLKAYLARLQNLAGDRPLVMGEIGLDSRRNGEERQASTLAWQIETAFEHGCAGAFVFAWTDEWYRGGHDVEDWDFGLTDRRRAPKPALWAVREAFWRAPFPPDEVDDTPWPRISVVVCSHNGARTLRDCCEGLLELDYPHYEVIVVDDGSTDTTSDIAAEYGFRVIRTPNLGLSSARNTGLEAANGEIVAYTDDDARPDPQWLRYLAITFLSTGYVGVGGPNIPPTTGGTIADCVANAPGGPAHVLVDDTEAEHIPGCNMAFRRSALLAVGGFDPRFRAAGDDVDICWQLQARGWKIGFNPAAMVFHHRRNSVRTYWRQQVGYGQAEALLEKKWPEKYNSAGHVRWGGRLYGDGLAQTLWVSRGRIYGGVWGSAPFQSVYGPAVNGLLALPAMPEWYFLTGLLLLVCALAIFWTPLLLALPFLFVSVAALLAQAILGGARARFALGSPPSSTLALRAITAALHLIQPLARLLGRVKQGLTPWRKQGAPSVALALPWPSSLAVWRETWQAPEAWLESVEGEIKGSGSAVERGGNYDRWDLHARGGLLGAARLRMGIEEHGEGRQLARFQVWPKPRIEIIYAFLIFACLLVGATLSGAWVAATSLGLLLLLFALRMAYECGIGVGTLRMGVRATQGVHLGSAGKHAQPYRLLLPYLSRYWRGWLLILLLTLLSTVVTLLQPWPFKVLVDNVLSGQPLSGMAAQIAAYLPGAASGEGLLWWVVLGGIALFLCASGINALLTYQWVRVGQGTVYSLARDLFARIQRRSLITHSRSAVGDSLSRITTDAWVAHTAADNLLLAPAHALITAASVLVLMYSMNPLLTVLALVLTPLMALSAVLFGGRIRTASRARRRIESQLQAHAHRNLSGMHVVQTFTREEHERDRFAAFARRSIEAQQRSALASNMYNLGSGLTLALGSALVLWVGAGEVLAGRLTVGGLLVFVAYVGVLQSQLKTFAGMARAMQEAIGSAERVAEVLNTRDEIKSKPLAPPLGSARGGDPDGGGGGTEIRLRNVTFGYEPGRPVLKDLSLQIKPGEMVGVVGPTGGGKSTLAGLVARLYDPWQGRVEIEGQDVRDVELLSLREAVAVALQEPYLFAATVADNLRYGRPEATECEVEAAAEAAGAGAFVRQLPDGYNTILGERGGTLSGGERQRLSIARALIKNAPILILDEPTSALDADAERLLVSALRRLRAGKTTIVVAHRLSTVRHADRIIVLQDGVVAEEGSHEELMARAGLYRHLYALQAGGQHAGAAEDACA